MFVRLSACPSVYLIRLGENEIISAANYYRGILFCVVYIPLRYEHLFNKYFVRRSVGPATKGRNVKIFKRNILGCYLRYRYGSPIL